jgi:hypothetical protein
LAAAVDVNTVGGVDVDVELRALSGMVARPEGGSGIEIGENTEQLEAT